MRAWVWLGREEGLLLEMGRIGRGKASLGRGEGEKPMPRANIDIES